MDLVVRRLVVRRMPGIVDGGYTLDGLVSGVNVVYGPNASGKTTTARAIEALFWPRAAAPADASLEAIVDAGGDDLHIEIDVGSVRYQRDGAPVSAPPLPAAESRDRYRLALPELLAADDAGFARRIALESAGGYDLRRAARVLDPRRAASRARREQDELKAALARLEAARQLHERLHASEVRLRSDERRMAEAGESEARLGLLELAGEYAQRRTEAEAARARLEAFPAVLDRLHGDEGTRLASLRQRLGEAREEAAVAEQARDGAAAELDRIGLPPALLEGDRLAAMLDAVGELDGLESQARSEEKARADAASRLADESRRLGPLADPDRLGRMDASGMRRLSELSLEAERARARRIALEAELRLLPETGGGERGRLERGAFLLQQWLRAGAARHGDEVSRKLALAASIALVVGGLGLAPFLPAALLLGLVGAVLLLLVVRRGRQPDARPLHQNEYLGLGLPQQPERWQDDAVRAGLDRLNERIAQAYVDEERARRRPAVRADLEEEGKREKAALGDLVQQAEAAGLDVEGAELTLVWLVERITRWQTARSDANRAEAVLVEAWRQRSGLLERANQTLAEVGALPASDLLDLRSRVAELESRARRHQEVEGELRAAERDLRGALRRIEDLSRETDELLERLEIGSEDEHRVAAWCDERPRYRETREAFEAAERDRSRLEARLREAEGFTPDLLTAHGDAFRPERAELRGKLEELDRLRDELTELRTRIEDAKRGHAVEDAVAEVERCREALAEVRERDIRSAIASVLVEHVERTTRDEHLPEVFQRANALFNRITRGRYELRLEEGDEPSFRAYDTQRERGQPLDELSSATRLQLLLAVRVAFVEVEESGFRLPLLMDETLANSDDDRAAAIMAAIVELATEGRQVFYFTAQPDEVGKWSTTLQGRPRLSGRVIDLAEVRRLERRLEPKQLEIGSQPAPAVLAPAGRTHADYGVALGVPALDLHAPLGAIHLWYLVEDTAALHELLSLRIESWGMLRSLVQHGGAPLLPADLLERVQLLAGAAEEALLRARIGRGLPVGREVLLASEAVSERFIEEVAELCRRLGGDAAAVIAGLERREVPGFLRRSIEALRDFFERSGHLDVREPLTPGQIRIEVLASLAYAVRDGRLAPEELDRLLSRLGIATPGGPADPVLLPVTS
jgi:hypothetical protein